MKPMMKNLAAVAGADAGSRLLGFLVSAYLARVIGPSSFGIISIATSVLGYAFLLAGPGLNVLGTRHVAASPDAEQHFAMDVIALRTALSLFWVIVACLIVLGIYGPSAEWLTVVLFVLAAIPMAVSPEWYIQGKSAMGVLAGSRLAMYAVYLFLVLLFVHGPRDTVWTGAAFTAASLVAAVILLIAFQRRIGMQRWQIVPARWPGLLRESIPLGVSTILGQTVVNLPVLIVGALLSSHETGLFGAAMKLVFFVLMIDRVFYLLFLPAASKAAAESPEKLGAVAGAGLKSVLAVSLPVALIGVFEARWVVSLIFGESFSAAAVILQWAMPYFAITVINSVMMTVLYAKHQEKEFARVLAVGTAILVVFCLVLTLVFGAPGSAMGLSAGELVMCLLLIRTVTKQVSLPVSAHMVPFLGAAVFMAMALAFLGSLPPVATSIGSVLVFAGSVFLFRGVTRDDLQKLREKVV